MTTANVPPEAVDGPQAVVDHITKCRPVQAAIVMQSGSADEVIAEMLTAGWTLEEVADLVAGKRIRYLQPPPGFVLLSAASREEPQS